MWCSARSPRRGPSAHPKKVVLFYHHTRTFYDLFEAIESVRGHDVALHHLAAFIVRDVDGFFLTPDVPILAGSRRVKQRLSDHNGLDANVEVFGAGVDSMFFDYAGPVSFESPLCIGRHEFPKRTELFLHAMLHVSGLQGRVLGYGSFTERLTALDGWLRLQHAAPPAGVAPTRSGCHVDDDRLWRDVAIHYPLADLRAAETTAEARGVRPRVKFLGRMSKDDLLHEDASALCVVCPAFDEDYGLTCLEAMALGKPVIACADGGGYVELIEDGVDGFLVEATGPAIAAAIERLKDPALARAMGARGREKAQAYTWPRAIDHVERALLKASAPRRSVRLWRPLLPRRPRKRLLPHEITHPVHHFPEQVRQALHELRDFRDVVRRHPEHDRQADQPDDRVPEREPSGTGPAPERHTSAGRPGMARQRSDKR